MSEVQESQISGPSKPARQQLPRDIKHPAGPGHDDEDPLSSVPASPVSMGTIDDEQDHSVRNVPEDSLPPPYTPTAVISAQPEVAESPMGQPQPARDYGSLPTSHPPGGHQMTQEDVETSHLLSGLYTRADRRDRLYMRRRKATSLCFSCCRSCLGFFIAVLMISLVLALIGWTIYVICRPDNSHESPWQPRPPPGDPLESHPHKQCPYPATESYNKTEHLVWTSPSPTFLIKEQPFQNHYSHRAWFDVNMRLLPPSVDQKVPIAITQSVRSTSQDIANAVKALVEKSSYNIDYVLPESALDGQAHCTWMDVDVYIQPDLFPAPFRALSLDLERFSVEFASQLNLPLTDSLNLKTVSGSVRAADDSHIAARKIIIEVDVGSVKGVFPLRDLLDISTTAGAIDISYLPSSALKSTPLTPAELTIQSQAGGLSASPVDFDKDALPRGTWPARRYITRLKTTSGTIDHTQVPLGELLDIETTAGYSNVEIMPIVFPALTRDSFRHTEDTAAARKWLAEVTSISRAGQTTLTFIEPAKESRDLQEVLNQTRAQHDSTAGGVTLRYPEAWAGQIHASSVTGSILLQGPRVQVIKHEKGWIGQEIWAVCKTTDGLVGGSEIEVRAAHGSLTLLVGVQ